MRYIEWAVLFVLSGLGIALANFVGFQVGFLVSLPGVAVLLIIAFLGLVVSKLIPVKLPIVAFVSIIGLLAACPASPVREFVIESTGKINFTAPLTMVGAYAGMSIGDQVKTFARQGWKMILVGVFVMTGTFLGSAIISQVVLSLTNVI